MSIPLRLTDATDLPAMADSINALHGKIEAGLTSMIGLAIEVGDKLIEVKDSLPHGEFTGWLAAHCKFSARTARGYMRLANNRDRLTTKRQSSAVLSIDAALRLLSELDALELPDILDPNAIDPLAKPTTNRQPPADEVEAAVRRNGRRRSPLDSIDKAVTMIHSMAAEFDDLIGRCPSPPDDAGELEKELAAAVTKINRLRKWLRGAA